MTRLPRVGALLALLLSACAAEEKIHQQQSYVFGTLVDVTVWGEDGPRAQAAVSRVLAGFDRLNETLHPWKPGPMTQLNAVLARAPEKAPIAPELVEPIRDATAYAQQSDGLFNPAIGRLVALWGFHSDTYQPALPDASEVARLVAANPRMTDVHVADGLAWSTNPAVRIDLGGYAKGRALDLAAAQLRAAGIRNALVNIGGNVIALGRRGDRPWRVGLQHPRRPGPLATLELADGEAVGTSGDYQRYFVVDGVRYCHVLDPRTGRPVQGVQAVSVVIPPGPAAGVRSDVASKPLFVAGTDGWIAAAARMQLTQALLVDGDGRVHVTPALRRRLKFVDPAPAVVEEGG